MLPLPGISSNFLYAQAKPAAAKPKAAPSPAAAAPTAAAPADPNVHYQKGVDHFAAGRYDEAIVEFKLAYAAGGPAALLFNIAQAHRSAGHAEEALAYYKEYLRVLPDAPNREDVEARMATIRKDLEVESETARAAAEAAKSPPAPVGTTAAGATATEPAAGVGVGSPGGRTVSPYFPGKKLKRAGIAVLGGGAVLFGLGIYFGVQAVNATDELDARAARGASWTASEQSIYDRGERDETIGASLVVVGAASLVTGAVILWIGSEQDQEAREFALVPVPGGAQMVMAWDF